MNLHGNDFSFSRQKHHLGSKMDPTGSHRSRLTHNRFLQEEESSVERTDLKDVKKRYLGNPESVEILQKFKGIIQLTLGEILRHV